MAEGQAGVSSLPLPPMQYVNLYTDENVKKMRVPRPPPPIQDNYSMFGGTISADDNIIQSLESQGLKRLYPQSYDHKRELKKLNHSILVNFLDLIDIMIKSPDSPKRTEKINDLNLLFIHIHHLINEFRPHQARETLRVMMQVQKRQRLETVERFQKHLDKVMELLQNCVSALPEDTNLDNKFLINTEAMDVDGTNTDAESGEKAVSDMDCMMCDIVEGLSQ